MKWNLCVELNGRTLLMLDRPCRLIIEPSVSERGESSLKSGKEQDGFSSKTVRYDLPEIVLHIPENSSETFIERFPSKGQPGIIGQGLTHEWEKSFFSSSIAEVLGLSDSSGSSEEVEIIPVSDLNGVIKDQDSKKLSPGQDRKYRERTNEESNQGQGTETLRGSQDSPGGDRITSGESRPERNPEVNGCQGSKVKEGEKRALVGDMEGGNQGDRILVGDREGTKELNLAKSNGRFPGENSSNSFKEVEPTDSCEPSPHEKLFEAILTEAPPGVTLRRMEPLTWMGQAPGPSTSSRIPILDNHPPRICHKLTEGLMCKVSRLIEIRLYRARMNQVSIEFWNQRLEEEFAENTPFVTREEYYIFKEKIPSGTNEVSSRRGQGTKPIDTLERHHWSGGEWGELSSKTGKKEQSELSSKNGETGSIDAPNILQVWGKTQIKYPTITTVLASDQEILIIYLKEERGLFPEIRQEYLKDGLLIRRGMSIAPAPESCDLRNDCPYQTLAGQVGERYRVTNSPALIRVIKSYLQREGKGIQAPDYYPLKKVLGPVSQDKLGHWVGCPTTTSSVEIFLFEIRHGFWIPGYPPSRVKLYQNGRRVFVIKSDLHRDYLLWSRSLKGKPLPLDRFKQEMDKLSKACVRQWIRGKNGIGIKASCYYFDLLVSGKVGKVTDYLK